MLGLLAFAQLLTAGVALAVRMERSQQVRVEEKVVTKIVTVAATPPKPAKEVVAVAPASPPPLPPPDPTPLPPARPLAAPPIADPVVERLVQEARKARLADDMASALNKLEEAQVLAPEDPSVWYETGQVYETMSAFDTRLADQASDAYLKVMSLGTTGAGALYPLAAAKIRDGISMPADLRGELALGNPRVFHDNTFENGERVVVTVPVQAAEGTEISANDLVVKVNFFDSTMKEGKLDVQPAADICETVHEWVSGEFDFVGGEELLRVTYTLPPQELQQDHLFGKRKYYGQTVEVFYKGELIDAHARPRHLSAFRAAGGRPADDMPDFITEDMIEYGDSVLPTREGDFLPPEMPDLINPDGSIPPLPEN